MDDDSPTSRLCIKNLPKQVTDARLKEHFSAKGEVTDVKVLRTRCGACPPTESRAIMAAGRMGLDAPCSATPDRILACRDGVSRQMGFVGYRTPEEAAAARKYFDRSYMDACRLTVEVGP